jgi:hypothetical protein
MAVDTVLVSAAIFVESSGTHVIFMRATHRMYTSKSPFRCNFSFFAVIVQNIVLLVHIRYLSMWGFALFSWENSISFFLLLTGICYEIYTQKKWLHAH